MTAQEQEAIIKKLDQINEKISASSAQQAEKDDIVLILNLVKTDVQNLVPEQNT